MTFGVLALIVGAGLAGPALAMGRRTWIPVVVGELAAGVAIGGSGAGWLDPTEPTVAFLGDVGLAMLMFAAGMHVPIRAPGMRRGLGRGAAAAVIAAVLGIPAGLAVAATLDDGDGALYALLLASGSAAIVLPALQERRLMDDGRALVVMCQVAIADVAAIVVLPLVLAPSEAGGAVIGGLVVACAALVALGLARLSRGHDLVRRIRRASKRREWALDLRLALLVLFVLAWLAESFGTSILVAGFSVGLLVAAIGGPKRLSKQVIGIAAGFFVPLFFVVLGARLDLRALVEHPSYLGLAAMLLTLNVAGHLAAAYATRQPPGAGLTAAAQLGLPAAAAALGLQTGAITPGQGAAIMLAALGSIAISTFGVARLAGSARRTTGAGA